MTDLDDVLPDEATALIDEYGKSISYTSTRDGAYDTATASKKNFAKTVIIKALVQDASGQTFNGNLVKGGDKLAYVAGQTFSVAPVPGDKYKVDGVTYTICEGGGVKAFYSGELVALYVLQGRLN